MFRFSIRDVLWLTVVVAVILTLVIELRRAQQRHHDLVTCGPNRLKPVFANPPAHN